jgi:hypothetical protein
MSRKKVLSNQSIVLVITKVMAIDRCFLSQINEVIRLSIAIILARTVSVRYIYEI